VPAKDLYISTLFKGMRRYAESNADKWFILSAKHGIVRPDEVIEPYECTLKSMTAVERKAWGNTIERELLDLNLIPAGSNVSILAGKPYRDGVVPFLEQQNCNIEIPMEGMRFGLQLCWLKEHASHECNSQRS